MSWLKLACDRKLPSIKVIAPGFQSTIQDLGRHGYAHLGVSASGAADPISVRLGNMLVGNPEDAPCLEMALLGGVFEFEKNCVVALTGSDFAATLDGDRVDPWMSLLIRAGQVLRCGSTQSGARCYLCIQGGLEIPLVLGSASTHTITGIGGLNGRALKPGDVLFYRDVSARDLFRRRRVRQHVTGELMETRMLRVTAGPQVHLFTDEARVLFGSSTYRVTEEANRMGLRLSGPLLSLRQPSEIITEGVALGAVQVPTGGEPIILFVEHQTTGGYPKIANVIRADLHRVGQLRPRDDTRFEIISIEQALQLLLHQGRLVSTESLEFI